MLQEAKPRAVLVSLAAHSSPPADPRVPGVGGSRPGRKTGLRPGRGLRASGPVGRFKESEPDAGPGVEASPGGSQGSGADPIRIPGRTLRRPPGLRRRPDPPDPAPVPGVVAGVQGQGRRRPAHMAGDPLPGPGAVPHRRPHRSGLRRHPERGRSAGGNRGFGGPGPPVQGGNGRDLPRRLLPGPGDITWASSSGAPRVGSG